MCFRAGVTLYAHTADNFLRMHQQPIPCRLREAAFSLDGLMEHDTELDPRVCYRHTRLHRSGNGDGGAAGL